MAGGSRSSAVSDRSVRNYPDHATATQGRHPQNPAPVFETAPLGVAPFDISYPLVGSAALYPVRRRRFGRAERDMSSLPEWAMGAVLVFQSVDNQFHLASHGSRWLADPKVVSAVYVAAVSLKHTVVPTTVSLPCKDPSRAVVIEANFLCHVTDPVLVLQADCWAVQQLLAQHLGGDDELAMLLEASEIATDPKIMRTIKARILTLAKENPPSVLGMTIELFPGSVGVHICTHSKPRCGGVHDSHTSDRDERVRDGDPASCPIGWEE